MIDEFDTFNVPSAPKAKLDEFDTFDVPSQSIPQSAVPAATPQPTISQPTINPDAYDPIKIMESMIVPKVVEYPKNKFLAVTPEESSGAMLALNKVWGLAKNPYDVVKGTAEFVASIPGFVEGVAGASWNASKALGQGADFMQTYEAASKGMQEMSTSWKNAIVDPLGRLLDSPKILGKLVARKITGAKNASYDEVASEIAKEEGSSEVVGEIAMAPYTIVATPIHTLADVKWLDDKPNARGVIKFGADALGLLFMGRIYRGGSAEFAKDVEPIITKANAINKQQKVIDEVPSEVLKKAQEKVLEVEKNQLELEAKALQDKLDHQKIAEEDLKAKGKEVQDIKEGKKTEVEISEDDRSMLETLGYEKDDIAEMTA